MTDAQLLVLLKLHLQIRNSDLDDYLNQLLETAKESVGEEGITIDYTRANDCQLVVLYAGWLYLRRLSGEEMPRMLRYKLNNRIFKQAITDRAETT